MKKLILSFGLVAFMAIGASAQTTATTEVAKTETKKSCAKKSCCKKKAATNGTAAATTTKCCKKTDAKVCAKKAETSSNKTIVKNAKLKLGIFLIIKTTIKLNKNEKIIIRIRDTSNVIFYCNYLFLWRD